MDLDPAIKATLQDLVVRHDHLEGLHFAAFLPRTVDGAPAEASSERWAVNTTGLRAMLHVYGLRHAPERQVQLWEACIPQVHRSFEALENAARPGADGKPLRLTRLVLDVEVGGMLYAAVGDRGWVFATTLNQQVMNNGRAEDLLLQIVRALRDLLERQSPADMETVR